MNHTTNSRLILLAVLFFAVRITAVHGQSEVTRQLHEDVTKRFDDYKSRVDSAKVRWNQQLVGKLNDRQGKARSEVEVLSQVTDASTLIAKQQKQLAAAWNELGEKKISPGRYAYLADQAYEAAALALWSVHQKEARLAVELIQQDYSAFLSPIRSAWTGTLAQAASQGPATIEGVLSSLAALEQDASGRFVRRYHVAARRLEMARRQLKSELENWASTAKQAKRYAAPEQFSKAVETNLESGLNERGHGVPSLFDRYLRQNDVVLATVVSRKSKKLSMVDIIDSLVGQKLTSEWPPNILVEEGPEVPQLVGAVVTGRPWAAYDYAPATVCEGWAEYTLYVYGRNLPAGPVTTSDPDIRYTLPWFRSELEVTVPRYEILHVGPGGQPPTNKLLACHFEAGRRKAIQGLNVMDAWFVSRMDVVILRARVPAGTTPGFRDFQLGNLTGEWALTRGSNAGRVRFVRPLGRGNFESPRELFIRDRFQLEVAADHPLDVNEIELVVVKNKKHIKIGGKETLIAKAIDSKRKIFRTQPIFIEKPNSASSYKDQGVIYQEFEQDDRLVAFPLRNVFLHPAIARTRVRASPADLGKQTYKGKDYRLNGHYKTELFRATKFAWDSGQKRQSVIFYPALPFPGTGTLASETAVKSIDRLVVFQARVHTTKITLGEHAAMLLLKKAFLEMAREQVVELETISKDEKLIRGWYHSMRPVMQQAGKLPPFTFPVAHTRVRVPHPVPTTALETQVPLWCAFDDAQVKRIFRAYPEKADAWVADCTTKALKILLRNLQQAIPYAEGVDDKDIERLLKLTGRGFKPVVDRVEGRLMKLVETQNASGAKRLEWVVDEQARRIVRRIAAAYAEVHGARKAAEADTEALLAVVGGFGLIRAVLLPGDLLAHAIILGSGTGYTATVARDWNRYLIQQRQHGFSSDAIAVLGPGRLVLERQDGQDPWQLYAKTFFTSIGWIADVHAMAYLLKLGPALERAPALLTQLERSGATAFGQMSRKDVREVLLVMQYARNLARNSGVDALSTLERRALNVASDLEDELLISGSWTWARNYGRARPAPRGRPVVSNRSRQNGTGTRKSTASPASKTSTGGAKPGSSATATRKPKSRDPGATTATSNRDGFKPPKEFSVYKVPDTDEVFRFGRQLNKDTPSAYADVFELLDLKTHESTGRVIKFIRNTNALDDSNLVQIVNRMERGWNHLKDLDDVLVAKCHRFETRGPRKFIIQDIVDFQASNIRRFTAKDAIPRPFGLALLRLYKRLSHHNLIWLDGNVHNVYFKLNRQTNRWEAGILDTDMIMRFDEPVMNRFLAVKLATLEVNPVAKGMNSLIQPLKGDPRTKLIMEGLPSLAWKPRWRNADYFMMKMLEHKCWIKYEQGLDGAWRFVRHKNRLRLSDVRRTFPNFEREIGNPLLSPVSRTASSTPPSSPATSSSGRPNLPRPDRTTAPVRGPPKAPDNSNPDASKSSDVTSSTSKNANKETVGSFYPGRRRPTSGASSPVKTPLTQEEILGARKAKLAIPRGHKDPDGVWDQDFLSKPNKAALKQRLDEFEAGTVGRSVRKMDVSEKTPEDLHDELMKGGFKHNREPLTAGKDNAGNQLFRKRNGTKTADPSDPDVVPHDIYTHPDGGMVRVKPEGAPGNPYRPEPHVSKSVLLDPKKGTGFDNEGFKVSNSGHAVPKSPSKAGGMKQAPNGAKTKQENMGFKDETMRQAHTNLPHEK